MPSILSSQILKPTNDKEFEEMTRDLYQRIWSSNSIQIYGRSGQKQNGVDIYDISKVNGNTVVRGIQCKVRKSKLLESEIVNEIELAESFEPSLNEYYVVTTLDRDVDLQNYVNKISVYRIKNNQFRVGIVFWQDIVSNLHEYKDVFYKYYSDFIYEKQYFDSSKRLKQINTSYRLLLGINVDLSRNMLKSIANTSESLESKDLSLAYKHVLFRINTYTSDDLTNEDLEAIKFISLASGLGDYKAKASHLLNRLGLSKKQNFPKQRFRNLFSGGNLPIELQEYPSLSLIKSFWPAYEKTVFSHLTDVGGSEFSIAESLMFAFDELHTALDDSTSDKIILLMILDDQTIQENLERVEDSMNNLRKIGVRVLYVVLSSVFGTKKVKFQSSEDSLWPVSLLNLYRLSDQFDLDDKFERELLSIAKENKITVPNRPKMMFIFNHQSAVANLIELLVAPVSKRKVNE